MAENGRKWQEMAGNGFPRVSRRGHRGSQEDHGRNLPKMVENGFPRLFGRKWTSRVSRRGHRGGQAGIDIGQNTLKISLPQK